MATATCQTVSGPYSAAQPFKLRSATCRTIAGAAMATGNVAWGGSSTRRKAVDWLPAAHTPLTLDGKTMNPVWYRAMHEMFERRMGGIDAPTIPQVAVTTQQTQAQVLAVQSSADAAIQTVNSCVDAVNIARQVAVDNDLSGAAQIPVVNRTPKKVAL